VVDWVEYAYASRAGVLFPLPPAYCWGLASKEGDARFTGADSRLDHVWPR
jgi:hypothetical protein